MKFLILACVLGIAAASFLERAAPAVDETVLAFLEGSNEAGSLSEALGVHEAWLDEAEDDIKTELGKKLKEALDETLQKIKDHIDHGKEIGQDLMDKVKELREKLKDTGVEVGNRAKELIEKIKEKAKEALQKLLEKLGLGKRNLDDQLDSVARTKLSELIEKIKEKILSEDNIQKIRDYIENIASKSPFVQELKKLIQKLQDGELKKFLEHLLEYKPGQSHAVLKGETWQKVKDFFKDLKVKISDHSKKFGEWVKDMWGKGLDKLKDKYGVVKAIAMEFIAHAKDTSAEVAREALEFFRPYKDDLGGLWQQIVDASKEAIGKF